MVPPTKLQRAEVYVKKSLSQGRSIVERRLSQLNLQKLQKRDLVKITLAGLAVLCLIVAVILGQTQEDLEVVNEQGLAKPEIDNHVTVNIPQLGLYRCHPQN